MAVVLTNFSAMFPFVACVKESENQPNGFVESHRNGPNQVRFRRSRPKQTLRTRLDNLVLSTELYCELATVKRLNGIVRTRMKECL